MTSVCPFIEQNRQQDMDGTHRLAIGNPCRGSHRIKNNSHRRTKAAAKISLHFLVERRLARETMAAKRRVVREVPRLQICFTRQRCGITKVVGVPGASWLISWLRGVAAESRRFVKEVTGKQNENNQLRSVSIYTAYVLLRYRRHYPRPLGTMPLERYPRPHRMMP